MQDDLGFMWFGSQDGLNKYYGTGIQNPVKIFKNDPTNKNSLSNSEISALAQIRQNLILVGTREGLNFFNPVTESFSRPQKADGKKDPKVNAIRRLDSSNAMIGTDEGLYIINLDSCLVKNFSFGGLKNVTVNCIEKISDSYYIGTEGEGLWRLEKNNRLSKINFIMPDLVKLNPGELNAITHIAKYGNTIYLGTDGYGIFKMDARTFEIESKISFARDEEASNSIRDFIIQNNKIIAATRFGVVVHNLITEETDPYLKDESPFSLNSNECTTVFVDSESNYWIGTNLGGINVSFFQSLKFPNSTNKIESRIDNIYAFLEEKRDVALIGSVKGFNRLSFSTGKVDRFPDLPNTVTILSVEEESENILWLGTWGNGIYRYDKKAGKARNFLTKESGGTIVCLKVVGNYLYAGSVGDGLFRIDLKTFEIKSYGTKDGLPNQSINSIFIDSRQNVWLATYDGGLVKMKGFEKNGKLPIEKVYSNTGKPGQIPSNTVFGVNEDKNGKIWVVTATGLGKLGDNDLFYNFYEKDGLQNTYLYAILRDSLDNFWMSSNNGIIRFNPLQRETEIVFKNYNVKDGLVNTEYNMGAALAGKSGYMYFGGARGFNAFRPSAIKDNLHAPNAYIISYTRGGTEVKTDTLITYKKHLKLSWSENYFMFELVALDYTDPAKNKFKYKLEGYDNDWSAPTSVRNVGYSKLEGGQYIFKVKAANNDGIWNEDAYELYITVVPPFWKTKWFYFIVIVLGLGTMFAFFQYRTAAIKKENRLLENKVAERTRELEEKNRDITSSIQYAKRIQEAILPSKEHIFKKINKIFILYQPKDIVSGDFYWFAEKDGVKIFAVVDCTGHGVPGAFMSMIGHNLLHRIVIEKSIVDPGEILNNLHKGVQEALRQGQNEIKTNDGMDCSIITINDSKREVKWAGANRPLILIDAAGELIKFDGNKFPVGGAQLEVDRVFTTHDITITGSTMAYMFTDGYADQFGGEKGKKFMVKRFHDLLKIIYKNPAEEQRQLLLQNFAEWSRNHEQVDDVLIVGIEI